MTAKWVVTTATERVSLDPVTRGGEATFTVTNQSAKSARAMFDIKTGEGVDTSWFTVDDPQRPIRPAASVPYLVKIQVPQTVTPGEYEFEARVFPPDSAPEENFVLSRRVLIEVPAPPAPAKKRFPWWIVVAAALLVLVIGIVTWLVLPSGQAPAPTASPSPTPTAPAPPVDLVAVPGTGGMTADNARKALTDAGLTVGTVTFRINSTPLGVVRQSLPRGLLVPKGTKVDIEIAVPHGAPAITAPGNNTSQPNGRWPTVAWTQVEPYISRWQIQIFAETCTRAVAGGTEACGGLSPLGPPMLVTQKEHVGSMPKLNYAPVPVNTIGTRHTGWITVLVWAIDDYGSVIATSASVRFFLEH